MHQYGAAMTDTVDLGSVAPFLKGQTFEEVTAGSRFRTAGRTVTESDLVAFVTLAGLVEPLFLDEAGSREAGYSGRLVPGTLTFAYAEGLVMQTGVLHGTGLAFLGASVDIKGPVFVGDTLHVVVEVLEARATKRGDRGVVTTRNTVVKGDGTVVLVYEPARMIKGRDDPA
jgi:acyl dehydratase